MELRTPPATKQVPATQRGGETPTLASHTQHDFARVDPSKRKVDREFSFAKALRQSKKQEILTKKRTLGRPEV